MTYSTRLARPLMPLLGNCLRTRVQNSNRMNRIIRRTVSTIFLQLQIKTHFSCRLTARPFSSNITPKESLWFLSDFTQKSWNKSISVYRKILNHPFVQELGSGTLPKEKFIYYIQQDYLFLLNRTEVYSILAKKAPTKDLGEYFQHLSEFSRKAADGIFKKYGLPEFELDQIPKSPACRRYMELMMNTAKERSFIEGFIVCLPCPLLYHKIAEELKSFSQPSNPYQLWIDSYSVKEKRERLEKQAKIVDQLTKNLTSEEFENLHALFLESMQCEYHLWTDSYYLSIEPELDVYKVGLYA